MARKREAVRQDGKAVRQNYKCGEWSRYFSVRETPINKKIHLRVHPEIWALWKESADSCGITLSELIRYALLYIEREMLSNPKETRH